jgi:flagellar hook-length control protein FliK
MKLEMPKLNTANDVQRNRIQPNQNNLLGFETDQSDDLPSNFADVFENVLQREEEKTEDNKLKNEDKKTAKDKEESTDGHKIVAEKKDDSEGESGENAETNAGLANFQAQLSENQKIVSENIPARAILHIADMERIVSAVRTQISDKGLPQIVIDLKRSILEGLQIKLSADQNGKIIAEFIASSEKVKNIIEAKNRELFDILTNRGIQVSSLKTTINGDSTNNENQEKPQEKFLVEEAKGEKLEAETLENKEINSGEVLKNVYRA